MKKIALVLSTGGVFGAAHVGALEVLDELSCTPDFIVGTSSGAIIGALYAAGGSTMVNAFLDELAASLASPRAYLINTPTKIFSFVRKLMASYVPKSYRALQIPMHPVATNVRTGMYTAFSSGNLVSGVFASAAYPGVFPMQKIKGELYIDGGVTANVPSPVAQELGATHIIGSSIYSLPKLTAAETKKLKTIKLAGRSLLIIQAQLAREQIKLCDYCFNPPVHRNYRWYNVRSLGAIRTMGRAYAHRHKAELSKVLATVR